MTATTHIPATDVDRRLVFGTYRRDGIEHEVLAVRKHGGPWQLIEAAGEGTAVVESFFSDEELDAVRAVAEMYLAEMRS